MSVSRIQPESAPESGVHQAAFYLSALQAVLERADPEKLTHQELHRRLEEIISSGEQPALAEAPAIYYAQGSDLFLANADLAAVYLSLEKLEELPVSEMVEFLEDTIHRRQAQMDLWPEGRLEMGIAYAALGEYERASAVLIELITICESGGRYYSENMAMAA
jgi:hypothetical protein